MLSRELEEGEKESACRESTIDIVCSDSLHQIFVVSSSKNGVEEGGMHGVIDKRWYAE